MQSVYNNLYNGKPIDVCLYKKIIMHSVALQIKSLN